ncbi:MAG: PRD domain-containing protein [Bifidobacterium tsurumiense]|uniref:PRD domain-containing protein n=1 Tax=Bifidobacterium tsurumiense TaxID=356829 RepID=UPI002A7FB463|nr:PRD domain-containing protein [Bifidobacterium tsurumiense]MDY4677935.1 PRD domain-containing protein [Bifidobacterium tsurumiense]
MEVLRVFNNNVILARDGNREVILTGRGLGFQAKPGQHVDDAKVVRKFIPSDGRDPDHMAELMAGIPPEAIRLVTEAMGKVGLGPQAESSPTLVMALADHVVGVLQRMAKGNMVEYPLQVEVDSLYPREYAQAEHLLDALNKQLDVRLPHSEAVAFALHLVNAGFSTGDLSATYTMTGVIQQILTVIERSFNVKLSQHSVSVGRFITHLRYLFVRIHQGKQLDGEPEPIVDAIRQSYPDEYACATHMAEIVELRLGASLSAGEVAYLALHVARVVADVNRGDVNEVAAEAGLQDD